MATTTPNYGWDVPTSTDYVADGAVAIETLGDDIDASLFSITGGKNVGLVQMVATQTFTAQSTVNFDNVFSADYRNYLVTISFIGSGTSAAYIRFRSAGVTLSDNIFSLQMSNAISAPTPSGSSRSDSFAQVMPAYATNPTNINMTFFNPFGSGFTTYLGLGAVAGSATDQAHAVISGQNKVSTSITGFTYTTASGVTMTGEARVYGLK
jgi:hypothetical protein